MMAEAQDRLSRLYYPLCLFVLFFATAAASFHGYYSAQGLHDFTFGDPHAKWTFESDVDGTDLRPFVFRQMLPFAVNWVDSRFSEKAKDKLYNLRGRNGLLFRERIIDSPIARDRQYFLRYWLMYGLIFLFAWLSAYAMYWLAKALGFPPAAAALASISIMIVLPYIQAGEGHTYDYPELAFMALAALMAIKVDWWWLAPLTALATFNKESFLLFVVCLYPLIRQRTSRANALIGTGVLACIAVAVNLAVRYHFRNNPGSALEIHLSQQLAGLLRLVEPRHMVMAKTYGIWAFPTQNLLTLVLIVWTVARVWRFLSPVLKQHVRIAAVINLPLYILFCEPGEMRDLSLLFVSFLVLLAASLTQWMGIDPREVLMMGSSAGAGIPTEKSLSAASTS
ncbi:MAG TPA: hypothetical protein VGL00_21620 [Terracidiphilus sp.]|jgi:hypothetical protein